MESERYGFSFHCLVERVGWSSWWRYARVDRLSNFFFMYFSFFLAKGDIRTACDSVPLGYDIVVIAAVSHKTYNTMSAKPYMVSCHRCYHDLLAIVHSRRNNPIFAERIVWPPKCHRWCLFIALFSSFPIQKINCYRTINLSRILNACPLPFYKYILLAAKITINFKVIYLSKWGSRRENRHRTTIILFPIGHIESSANRRICVFTTNSSSNGLNYYQFVHGSRNEKRNTSKLLHIPPIPSNISTQMTFWLINLMKINEHAACQQKFRK